MKLSDLIQFRSDPFVKFLTLREKILQEKKIQLKQVLLFGSELSEIEIHDSTSEEQWVSFDVPRQLFHTKTKENQSMTWNALYQDRFSDSSELVMDLEEPSSVPIIRLEDVSPFPTRGSPDLLEAMRNLQLAIVSLLRVYQQTKEWAERATEELQACAKLYKTQKTSLRI
eukprot:g9197.t1